jgi:hypothetical protein
MAWKNKTAAERKMEADMYNFASTAGGGAMALPYQTDRQAINLKQAASNDRKIGKAARPQPFKTEQQ